jgi:hypothetical protein
MTYRNSKEIMMANLVDMTIEKDDSQKKEAGNAPAIEPSKGPQYPSGLNLYLDSDTVEKLGLEGCEVGSVYDITAKGKVTSISENDTEGSDYNKTITIQLTNLGCEEASGNEDNLLGQDKEKEVMETMESKMKDSIAYVNKRK